MLDVTAPPASMQRIQGRAAAEIGPGGRILGLHQQGSAKVMLPKMHGRPPEVVFLNTAGGVTGGDRLSYQLDVTAGASAVGTTQTAERAYRAKSDFGQISTQLSVGEKASLHWLPQELILFEASVTERDLHVEMAGDAEVLILETLVLGRAAMGEQLCSVSLFDRRSVRRGGRLVMTEPFSITSADLEPAKLAGLNGALALASLSLFAPDAEDRIGAVRAVLPTDGSVLAAASAWDGRITARFMGSDAYALRRVVARAVETVTRGPLPRVWQI